MVTWRLALALLLVGCSGRVDAAGEGQATSPARGEEGAPLPPPTVEPGGAGPQYPGAGFRVHEWGTNTVVVGSDGSLQRGLHHEEEDLPSFVYDRRSLGVERTSVEVKMETPVAYFYSERPMTARVDVRFPDGVLTQWYPGVVSYFPWVLAGKGDPVFDRSFPYSTPECRATSTSVKNGLLDWGNVAILARDAKPVLPDAPLARFTWSHARDVAANPVRVTPVGSKGASLGTEEERFLFYRGLGNFPLATTLAARPGPAGDDGGLVLANGDRTHAVGAVFVLRVEAERAAFAVRSGGVPAGGALEVDAPPATEPIEAYAADLARAMVVELDRAGLYHDESVAMVKTWARQWFRTPGVRVLYLAPRAWTDAQIPLSIAPAPEELVRVMVIRIEAITRRQEQVDVARAKELAGDDAARQRAEAHFASLGRFAEPRLRRALDVVTAAERAGAAPYLDAISGANVTLGAGE
jgi:hypothetical protein